MTHSRVEYSSHNRDSYPHTMLFPEGACTNGTALILFKAGAFRPGLPVLPVIIRYPHEYYNPVCF
jgi:lysophosphatidylcholine acyltransferase/lyso-PAF acetyltransferase